eukprot:3778137-Rhodomonas_salina.1
MLEGEGRNWREEKESSKESLCEGEAERGRVRRNTSAGMCVKWRPIFLPYDTFGSTSRRKSVSVIVSPIPRPLLHPSLRLPTIRYLQGMSAVVAVLREWAKGQQKDPARGEELEKKGKNPSANRTGHWTGERESREVGHRKLGNVERSGGIALEAGRLQNGREIRPSKAPARESRSLN